MVSTGEQAKTRKRRKVRYYVAVEDKSGNLMPVSGSYESKEDKYLADVVSSWRVIGKEEWPHQFSDVVVVSRSELGKRHAMFRGDKGEVAILRDLDEASGIENDYLYNIIGEMYDDLAETMATASSPYDVLTGVLLGRLIEAVSTLEGQGAKVFPLLVLECSRIQEHYQRTAERLKAASGDQDDHALLQAAADVGVLRAAQVLNKCAGTNDAWESELATIGDALSQKYGVSIHPDQTALATVLLGITKATYTKQADTPTLADALEATMDNLVTDFFVPAEATQWRKQPTKQRAVTDDYDFDEDWFVTAASTASPDNTPMPLAGPFPNKQIAMLAGNSILLPTSAWHIQFAVAQGKDLDWDGISADLPEETPYEHRTLIVADAMKHMLYHILSYRHDMSALPNIKQEKPPLVSDAPRDDKSGGCLPE